MLTAPTDPVQQAFVHAARKGERLVSIDGGAAAPPVACCGCGRSLEPPLAFAPLMGGGAPGSGRGLDDDTGSTSAGATDDAQHYCGDCRAAFLGPPCAGCGQPVSRADGLLALDAHWHRGCLRCSHEPCRALECISYAAKGGCSCHPNVTCSSSTRVCRKGRGGNTTCEDKVSTRGYCTDVPRRAQLSSLVVPPPSPAAPPSAARQLSTFL